MSIESPVQGNIANRFFNKIAERADRLAGGLKKSYLEQPIHSAGDGLDHEIYGLAILPVWLTARTVQALASLSASITGGRKSVPLIEPTRVRF